jgi:hypothetical protein
VKPQYMPKTREQFYGYLVEEAGEVLAAAGKTLRWGELSANPELPPAKRVTNIAWLRAEMSDLELAIRLMREHLDRAEDAGELRTFDDVTADTPA